MASQTPDPASARTVEQLDQVGRVLPGLLRTLDGLVAEAHRIAAAMGLTVEQWRALPFEEREEVIRAHGKRSKKAAAQTVDQQAA